MLAVAAHPDDETVGSGALLCRTKNARVIHVTGGSPLDGKDSRAAGFTNRRAYAEARRHEAEEALRIAGIGRSAIIHFNFIDQGVSFLLCDLIAALLKTFKQLEPDLVMTHAYEGGHPDHDSVAFACRIASDIYNQAGGSVPLSLYEFAGYHGRIGYLMPNEFLPNRDTIHIRNFLSSGDCSKKRQMLSEFRTQQKTLEPFFSPTWEVYRQAPRYDFSMPPHPGKLFYENFDWGITNGAQWRSLAYRALREILPTRIYAASSDHP